MRVPVSAPWLTDLELGYAMDAIRSGHISGSGGEYVERFESAFAKFCHTRYAVSCSSGTSALQLAVRAVGIGRGDEVIVPTFTNIATILAVIYAGAKPVLVDSRPDTWCMDEQKIERCLTKRTRAIMPVHIYGHPVDMGFVTEVAEKRGLTVIEDAAEAHGALCRGKSVGGLGDIGCFSFYANKIVTTGEGGIAVTNSERLASKLRALRNLAFGDGTRYRHTDLGYNYRLSNVLAAIGLAQLERVDELVAKKIEMASSYRGYLGGHDELTLPVEASWAKNVYWVYGILLNRSSKVTRDRLMQDLARVGIETRSFFYPMHLQAPLRRLGLFRGQRFPVSEDISRRGLYVPSGLTLAEEQIEYVCKKIIGFACRN